jgi:hypothetical protein
MDGKEREAEERARVRAGCWSLVARRQGVADVGAFVDTIAPRCRRDDLTGALMFRNASGVAEPLGPALRRLIAEGVDSLPPALPVEVPAEPARPASPMPADTPPAPAVAMPSATVPAAPSLVGMSKAELAAQFDQEHGDVPARHRMPTLRQLREQLGREPTPTEVLSMQYDRDHAAGKA